MIKKRKMINHTVSRKFYGFISISVRKITHWPKETENENISRLSKPIWHESIESSDVDCWNFQFSYYLSYHFKCVKLAIFLINNNNSNRIKSINNSAKPNSNLKKKCISRMKWILACRYGKKTRINFFWNRAWNCLFFFQNQFK